MKKNKAIFLDRDGVLNFPIIRNKKPFSPINNKQFKIYDAVKKLNKFRQNYYLIVITNQPDIKTKKISLKTLKSFHNKINKKIKIDKFYICTHTNEDKCKWRKPNIKFFLDAKKKYKINFKKSYFIGDRWKDMIAGNKIKCKNIFINKNYAETKNFMFKYDFICKDLKSAIKFIDC